VAAGDGPDHHRCECGENDGDEHPRKRRCLVYALDADRGEQDDDADRDRPRHAGYAYAPAVSAIAAQLAVFPTTNPQPAR
jgi:hypothetical protein